MEDLPAYCQGKNIFDVFKIRIITYLEPILKLNDFVSL